MSTIRMLVFKNTYNYNFNVTKTFTDLWWLFQHGTQRQWHQGIFTNAANITESASMSTIRMLAFKNTYNYKWHQGIFTNAANITESDASISTIRMLVFKNTYNWNYNGTKTFTEIWWWLFKIFTQFWWPEYGINPFFYHGNMSPEQCSNYFHLQIIDVNSTWPLSLTVMSKQHFQASRSDCCHRQILADADYLIQPLIVRHNFWIGQTVRHEPATHDHTGQTGLIIFSSLAASPGSP